MNLADKLHEHIEKHQRIRAMETNEIEVTKAEKDELDNWWIDHTDDLNEALEAVGVLGVGKLSWFPHPEWLYRLPNLGLSEEDTQAVIKYIEEDFRFQPSLILLDDIESEGVERAITAYAKRCKQKGIVFNQPDAALSTIETEDFRGMYNRFVVVLRNVNGELTRYEPFPKWKDYEYAGFGLRYVE
jgi:hypothetical protein